MSSEPGHPSRASNGQGDNCPDFSHVTTGVGRLPVPAGMAGQMHLLEHNALARRGEKRRCTVRPPETATEGPLRALITPRPIQRHHPPTQNRSPAPRPPPSDSLSDLMKQWERLLTWATLKTLTDFSVMPAAAARATSRRLATRILDDYGPSLHKWLGSRGP